MTFLKHTFLGAWFFKCCVRRLVTRVFVLVCLVSGFLTAQGQEPIHKVYDYEDGLYSNDVRGVSQDNLGYIWFLNGEGITRFDGVEFDYTPMGTDFYKKMYRDWSGRVWLFGNALLSQTKKIYFCESGNLYEYPYSHVLDSISGIVKTMLVDSSGNVWFGLRTEARDGRPSFIRISAEGKVKRFHFEVPDTRYTSLLMKVDDSYLYSVKGTRPQFAVSFRLFVKEGEDTFSRSFPRTHEAGFFNYHGRKFFSTRRDGIFELIGKEMEQVSALSELAYPFLYEDKEGRLFIPSSNYGLYCYESMDDLSQSPQVLFPEVHFNTVFQGEDGSYWLGTRDKGLFYIPSLNIQTFNKKMGLSKGMVRSLQVTDSTLWITYRQALSRVSLKNGITQIENYHIGGALHESYLFRDSVMFIGGVGNMSIPKDFPYDVSVWPAARKMRPFSKGKLSYTSGHSLHSWYGVPRGRILHFVVGDFVKSQLQIEYNHFLYSDVGGFKRYLRGAISPFSLYDTLFAEPVHSIEPIGNHWTLLASQAYGVIAMKDSLTAFSFGKKNGLSGNICKNLCMDQDSTFWVVTENGLDKVKYQIRRDTVLFEVVWQFGKEYGVPFADAISLKVNEKDAWIAFRHSVLRIPKNLYDEAQVPLKPIVEKVYKSGVKLKNPNNLVLSYFSGVLDFEITSPCFTTPRELQFQYQLAGVDTVWKSTSKRILSLEAVPPGEHVLQIVAVNDLGLRSDIANVSLKIEPLFWQTLYFKILLCVLFLLVITFYGVARKKQKTMRKRLMGEIKGYKNRALRLQMNPHFVYNSLGSIQSFVLKEESKISSKYIVKLSRLMRLIFDHNNCELITLKQELEALNLYVDLEFLRHDQQLKFDLLVDEGLVAEYIMVPPMLLQPLVENAILHGLVPKRSFGLVSVAIEPKNGGLQFSVSDNGEGIRFSRESKKSLSRRSGGAITSDRVSLFNQQHDYEGFFKFDEQNNLGTRITFAIPLIEL